MIKYPPGENVPVFTYKDWQNAHHYVLLSDCVTPRREVYSAPTLGGLSSDSDREHEDEDGAENDDPNDLEDIATNTSSDSSHGEEDTGTVWLWTEGEYKHTADSNPGVYEGNRELEAATCCPFGCNHLHWRVSPICGDPDLYSLCGGQLLIKKKKKKSSNKYYFIIFKRLIVVLFHTTGGSDEGQDWELTKVGGYIQCGKTVMSWNETNKRLFNAFVFEMFNAKTVVIDCHCENHPIIFASCYSHGNKLGREHMRMWQTAKWEEWRVVFQSTVLTMILIARCAINVLKGHFYLNVV